MHMWCSIVLVSHKMNHQTRVTLWYLVSMAMKNRQKHLPQAAMIRLDTLSVISR